MLYDRKRRLNASLAVLILACYTNPGSVWAQEVCNSSVIFSDVEPFDCGFEGDLIIPGERWVRDHRNDPVLGPFPVLVILVNFEEDPDCGCEDCGSVCYQPDQFVRGHPPGGSGEWDEVVTTAEEAYGIFFDDSTPGYLSVKDYYDEVSYGRMQLIGDAAGYYTLDIDLCTYDGTHCRPTVGIIGAIRNAGVAAAEADGWDVHLDDGQLVSDTYEGVVFAFPRYPGSRSNGGTFVFQNRLHLDVSAHELGHMLDLGHANNWECGNAVWGYEDNCSYEEYGNIFDMMGALMAGHFNAAFKRRLGWLDDGTQLLTLTEVSDAGTYYLTPLEVAGDNLVNNIATALRIPREDEHYYIEFRQALGFDELLYNRLSSQFGEYFPEIGFDGLMANRFPSSGRSTFLLDMTPDSRLGQEDFLDAALLAGTPPCPTPGCPESEFAVYTDSVAGFEIAPVEINYAGTEEATLEVEIRFSTIDAVDLGPDRSILFGEEVLLEPVISGGTPPYMCKLRTQDNWDEPVGINCAGVTLAPRITTPYLVEVYDDQLDDVPRGAWVKVEVIFNDCNYNVVPDECDLDCAAFERICQEIEGCGDSLDCQPNGIPDECDIVGGDSHDFDENGIPDECDPHRLIYVDDVTDPQENGSLEHPYDTIAEAINDSISWDTIVVRDGVYMGEGNHDLSFAGRSITVRSANGPASCTIDCGGNGRAFIFDNQEGTNAIVDGFTIVNGSANLGGAIYLGSRVQAAIRNCVITGNSAESGGGIYANVSYPTISNCKITDNTAAEDGGGFAYVGNAFAPNPPPPDQQDPKISSCTITGNLALNGGGLAVGGSGESEVQIHNCTIIGNHATSSGGGIYCNGSSPTLQNCILWDDAAPTGSEVAILPSSGSWTPTLTVDYSDVEGGVSEVYIDPNSNIILDWGGNNIAANPWFVEPGYYNESGTPFDPDDDFWSEGDYHLLPWSPCVDAGDNSVVGPGEFDMDGSKRVFDGDGDGEPIVDMGADEYVCPPIVSSDPPDGAIDARQPFEPSGGTLQGWRSIEITLASTSSDIGPVIAYNDLAMIVKPVDFTVTQIGGTGPVPAVTEVQVVTNDTVLVILSHPIEVGAWTVITHNCSGTSVRLGYLPGDVNSDAVSNMDDVQALMAYLIGENSPLPVWSTDINRDGRVSWADLRRLIELLEGVGVYAPGYLNATLP